MITIRRDILPGPQVAGTDRSDPSSCTEPPEPTR